MRIDAHLHLWRLADRAGQWPPPELAAIHRDFMPTDLLPLLDEAGLDGAVLVQSLPSAADTAFLLGLAAIQPAIKGVVGWAELKAPDAPKTIARLARDSKLKGLRPMLQDIADIAWIGDPALTPAVTAMVAHDLAFDALVRPDHLPHLLAFAERHRDLRIVIDHGGKPEIGAGQHVIWRQRMEPLAALPHVTCKLSGLLTQAGEGGADAVRPYAETLLTLFGPERVVWGSDWPVLTLVGNYAGWLAFRRDLVPAMDHAAVFGGNAARIYRLDPPAADR